MALGSAPMVGTVVYSTIFFSKFSPGIEAHWNGEELVPKIYTKKSGSEQCKVMDCGEYIMFCPDLS